MDVDGDGDVDLVINGVSPSGLSLSRNNGGGSFAPPVPYPPVPGTSGVATFAVGDIDGDGDVDAVFTRTLSVPTVWVYWNDGSGAFGAPALLFDPGAGNIHPLIELGDLDGDADLDLVLADSAETTNIPRVRSYLNDGLGGFALASGLQLGNTPATTGQTLVLVDIDADLDLDMVANWRESGLQTDRIRIVLNLGGGILAAGATYVGSSAAGSLAANVTALAAADLDGDALPDLVWADLATRAIRVRLATGATAQHAIPGTVNAVGLRDMDGDADPDLIAAEEEALDGTPLARNVYFYRNNAGSFGAPILTPATMPDYLVLADIDGDQDVDVLPFGGSTCGASTLDLLRNDGSGSLTSPSRFGDGDLVSGAFAEDVDGDGDRDLVYRNRAAIVVARAAPGGLPTTIHTIALGGSEKLVACSDIDGDGDVDLLTFMNTFGSTPFVRYFSNDGFGQFAIVGSLTPPGPTPISVCLGDIDGDSDQDLLVLDLNSNSVAFYRNQGAFSFVPLPSFVSPFCCMSSAVFGDLDGDGDLDLVLDGQTRFSVCSNDGTGVFTASTPTLVSEYAAAVIRLADLDGDGDLDLVRGGSQLKIFENDGAGNFSSFEAIGGCGTVLVEDLDGDLDLDLVGGSRGMVVYENRGDGTYYPAVTHTVDGRIPVVADFDLDGRVDVAVAHTSGTPPFDFFQNLGTCTSGSTFCVGDGTGTPCPCGNHSPIGANRGCANSLGLSGQLRASGVASLAADGLVLVGEGMSSTGSALYFQGTLGVNADLGAVFGDGLRCAGGSTVRLGTKFNSAGRSSYPGTGDSSISVRGGIGSPGTYVYQAWYRNSTSYCTVAVFNLTNGVRVAWSP